MGFQPWVNLHQDLAIASVIWVLGDCLWFWVKIGFYGFDSLFGVRTRGGEIE